MSDLDVFTQDWAERKFWPKINKRGPRMEHMKTRCWEWTGHIHRNGGHGKIHRKGFHRFAHRVRFALKYGRWPEGLLCHRCDNPRCVRLGHLYEGDGYSNMRDRAVRGRRLSVGEENPLAKLTQAKADEIRRLRNEEGLRLNVIAAMFDICFQNVSMIARGELWVPRERRSERQR